MPSKRKPLSKLIQGAIDRGATTVEEIHKSIVDLPLRILEESGLLKTSVKKARRLQDQSIGAVYDLIREINEEVGTLASQLLAKAIKRRPARPVAARKAAGKRSIARVAR